MNRPPSPSYWPVFIVPLVATTAILTMASFPVSGTLHWILGIVFIASVTISLYATWKMKGSLEAAIEREKNFVSLVSHQLRIPLTELSWMIDSVFETTAPAMTAEQMETVQEMRGIVRNSVNLVGELLDVSRLDRGTIQVRCEETHLRAIAEEALKPLERTAAERGIEVRVTVPDQLVVYADARKAAEAVRNVIDNALRYGPRNTAVDIGAGPPARGFAILTVNDRGPGIPEEIRPHLFDKAAALSKKESDEGAGLGLFIAKRLMELMNGDISYETSPNGTTFMLRFSTEKTEGCSTE